jgi:hypothetical protein
MRGVAEQREAGVVQAAVDPLILLKPGVKA